MVAVTSTDIKRLGSVLYCDPCSTRKLLAVRNGSSLVMIVYLCCELSMLDEPRAVYGAAELLAVSARTSIWSVS